MNPGQLAPAASKQSENWTRTKCSGAAQSQKYRRMWGLSSIKHNLLCLLCKYPCLQGVYKKHNEKSGIWLWKFREERSGRGDDEGVKRHFLKVCAVRTGYKAQKWCIPCGSRWKSGQQAWIVPVVQSALCRFQRPEPLPKLGRYFAMAEETKGAEIVQIALAASFGYGDDVVGIPEAAAGSDGFESIEAQTGCPGSASGSLQRVIGRYGIDMAEVAAAMVAREDLVPEVAGIGTETPLVNAIVATEGAAAPGEDFEVAPTAERQAIRAFCEGITRCASSGEGARNEHDLVSNDKGAANAWD
jgi:hypothetical protein